MFSLSVTLRRITLPWIFREVYNWATPDGSVWPQSVWPFLRTIHIRDRSMAHPGLITVSPALLDGLTLIPFLSKITVRLESGVPADLLQAISRAPSLTFLEIHQARFDGPFPSPSLPFPALERLSICIAGFEGVVRYGDLDRVKQASNIVALLRGSSAQLVDLSISGDLISPAFLDLKWPQLRTFTITEHTPIPYISVPKLVSQMPGLREVSILYTADLSRDSDAGEMYPPFQLGDDTGILCCPFLARITLSNMAPTDPIFAQLPVKLQSLHLRAMFDGYHPILGFPKKLGHVPLTDATAQMTLQSLAHLKNLTALSLTVNDYPQSPLILQVATVFPQLQFLELDNSAAFYWSHRAYLDVLDPAIADALQLFPHITHLHISMNLQHISVTCIDVEAAQKRGARWLFKSLPSLQIIAFSRAQFWCISGFDRVVWRHYDRSLLLQPEIPPPIEIPIPESYIPTIMQLPT
ncbi:hypothetical protein R3P38DRAFT_3001502 [Favolaschia claudopus]|uniref:F-box domain-containing protein n=1 Tax=Favolaschia claudopus TaxID=2862362 RepID=A0AAW0AMU2_9AGAR